MHFHLPKPLHGWRQFVGEVGIIVIGVLIALGAEQVVERMRWKVEVAEARHSLDAQLLGSKFAALERIKLHDCTARKLDRLDDLIAASNRPRISSIDLNTIRLWGTSSWQSATSSGAIAHMNSDERDLYARLFSLTDVLGGWNRQEYDLVGEVRLLDKPRTLSTGERDRLTEDIARLRNDNDIIWITAQQWLGHAKPLNLDLSSAAVARLRQVAPCVMPDETADGR